MTYVPAARRNRCGFMGLAVMVGSLIGVGCGSEPADDGAPGSSQGAQTVGVDDGGLFCSALAVLRDNCVSCHNPARVAGAPMSLQTYQELTAPAFSDATRPVYQLISARIHDPVRPMPQLPAVLDPAAMATLDAWIAGGANPGLDPTCSQMAAAGSGAGTTGAAGATGTAGTGVVVGDTAGTGAAGVGAAGTGEGTAGTMATAGTGPLGDDWPADCEEVYTITAYGGSDKASKYTVPAGSEEHPQFSWTSPWGTGEVQAVKFRPITDNVSVLHHWILYGPSGGGLLSTDKFITGWAPGSDSDELPPNVGMYLPSGTLRLDVHYYNKAGSSSTEDKSGVEICVIKTKANFREFTAGVIGLTGSATANAATTTSTPVTCTAQTTSGPVTLLGVSPHMHKLGTRGYLAHTPAAGGTPMVLHDQPFSFEDQKGWPLDNIQVNNGDKLTTRCTYVNPTDTTVRFGQDTDDEMCFNFTTYYPYGTLTCGQSI
jgi:Copper type II ascorbate-dependent monooxygenase, C-terminal domain